MFKQRTAELRVTTKYYPSKYDALLNDHFQPTCPLRNSLSIGVLKIFLNLFIQTCLLMEIGMS